MQGSGDGGRGTMTPVQEAVCAHFDVSLTAIRGGGRRPRDLVARRVAYYLEREVGRSVVEVAELYDRDHSMVSVAHRAVAERLAAGDPEYAVPVMKVKQALAARELGVARHGGAMFEKKTVVLKNFLITLGSDGSGRLEVETPEPKDCVSYVLPPEVWAKLGDSLAWWQKQSAAQALALPAVIPEPIRSDELVEMRRRLEQLEARDKVGGGGTNGVPHV